MVVKKNIPTIDDVFSLLPELISQYTLNGSDWLGLIG